MCSQGEARLNERAHQLRMAMSRRNMEDGLPSPCLGRVHQFDGVVKCFKHIVRVSFLCSREKQRVALMTCGIAHGSSISAYVLVLQDMSMTDVASDSIHAVN
jgi:hypothetical protein